MALAIRILFRHFSLALLKWRSFGGNIQNSFKAQKKVIRFAGLEETKQRQHMDGWVCTTIAEVRNF